MFSVVMGDFFEAIFQYVFGLVGTLFLVALIVVFCFAIGFPFFCLMDMCGLDLDSMGGFASTVIRVIIIFIAMSSAINFREWIYNKI